MGGVLPDTPTYDDDKCSDHSISALLYDPTILSYRCFHENADGQVNMVISINKKLKKICASSKLRSV